MCQPLLLSGPRSHLPKSSHVKVFSPIWNRYHMHLNFRVNTQWMTYNLYPSRCPSWPHYDWVLPAAQSQYRRDKLRKKYWISIRRSSSLLPLWMEGLLLGDCFLLPLSLRHCFGVSDYCRPKHWRASKDGLTRIPCDNRFPSLLWCVPRILFQDNRVCRKSLHSCCWYCCFWVRLSGCSSCYGFHPTLLSVSKADDMDRLSVISFVSLRFLPIPY